MFVYSITHKNSGKQYIGLDTGLVAWLTRPRAHFAGAEVLRRGGKLRTQSKIAAAIAKNGDAMFSIAIEATFSDFQKCKDYETELIASRNTIKGGYNILPGGQGLPRNEDVDPELLAVLKEARSRGAAKANANRWSKDGAKKEMASWLHTDEVAAKKSESLSHYWGTLSEVDRAGRRAARVAGNPWLYVCGEESDTNLRLLLGRLPRGEVSHRAIEKAVRETGKYEGHIVITRKKNG